MENDTLESTFPKLQTFSNLVEPLLRNCDQNLAQIGHAYAIYCRPKVARDVISGRNVKTIEGYEVLNFENASSSSFKSFQKDHFVTVKSATVARTRFTAERK